MQLKIHIFKLCLVLSFEKELKFGEKKRHKKETNKLHLNQKLNHSKFLSKYYKTPGLKYDLCEELFNVEIAVQYMIKSITKVKALELKTVF